MLKLDEILNKMAKASGVRWLEYVLRRKVGDVLRDAMKCKVEGRRERG